MVFLIIQFNFHDIVVSVFQAQDDFLHQNENKMATDFETKPRLLKFMHWLELFWQKIIMAECENSKVKYEWKCNKQFIWLFWLITEK